MSELMSGHQAVLAHLRDHSLTNSVATRSTTILNRIPSHILVAASAWGSRAIMILSQFISIRILVNSLGIDQYAIFALLTGLVGWFALADVGLGYSLQNYISEQRAKGFDYDVYITTCGGIAVTILIGANLLLYFASPYLGEAFLRNANFIETAEKAKLFFITGTLYIAIGIGSISYKVWYATHKGYWANIASAVASLGGVVGVWIVAHGDMPNELFLSLVMFSLPAALISLGTLACQVRVGFKHARGFDQKVARKLIRRALGFGLFALLSAGVLQIDYVVMSQFLSSREIVAYFIATKVVSSAYFVYGAMLSALWPIFAELTTKNDLAKAVETIKKYLGLGVGIMLLSTVFLTWSMPAIAHVLSPSEQVTIPVLFVPLLGLYYAIRVWTDTFSTVLQSMTNLVPLWLFVPFQAAVCAGLQWYLTPRYGIYGLTLGLIGSFLLTVSWGLPLATRTSFRRRSNEYEHQAFVMHSDI